MIQETLVLFSNIRKPHYTGSLQEYEANGGYLGLKKALNMQPEEIVNLVKESGLSTSTRVDRDFYREIFSKCCFP